VVPRPIAATLLSTLSSPGKYFDRKLEFAPRDCYDQREVSVLARPSFRAALHHAVKKPK